MSDPHVPAERLDRYVTGGLSAADERAVERHCAACDPCGEALQRAAQGELLLHDVARAHRANTRGASPAVVRALRVAGVGGMGLALAAAAVMLLGFSSAPRGRDAATSARVTVVTTCGDGAPCGSLASRGIDASWRAD